MFFKLYTCLSLCLDENPGSTICSCPAETFERHSNITNSTTCIPCSKNLNCPSGQYQVQCTGNTDAHCLSCSSCALGYYVHNCRSDHDGICTECSNKYETQRCNSGNTSVSFYTGFGNLDANDCAWECINSFYKSNGVCLPCTTTQCAIGLYRTNCTSSADGYCIPCSNLPDNAYFLSAGLPFNYDNCTWTCNHDFFLDEKSGVCTPCSQPTQCNLGEYLAPCRATSNYLCQPCTNNPNNSIFSARGICTYQCEVGYFFNSQSRCETCNYSTVCPNDQVLVNCTPTFDSFCSYCKDNEYLKGQNCSKCTDRTCLDIGMYLQPCSPVADSRCSFCTNAPLNAYYVSSGGVGNSNCSWQCNAGFQPNFSNQFCLPCSSGSYSQRGNTSCALCPAGTFSSIAAATSSTSCNSCPKGKYSNIAGASSALVCLECPAGYFQGQPGQSICDACQQNSFGTNPGSTSQSECQACPSDTTTRGATGRANATGCICNNNFYRIKNGTTQCQKCPRGLICTGYSDYQVVVNGSVWQIINVGFNDLYRLVYCPVGYVYSSLDVNVTIQNYDSIMSNQDCAPCPAGQECTNPPCSSCAPCKPGHFKSCTGPQICTPCQQNSFQPANGSFECHPCDTGMITNGLVGCTNSKQCVCDSSHYKFDASPQCEVCPIGMQCFGNATADGLPLLFGSSSWAAITISEAEGSRILYDLVSCTSGYYIQGDVRNPGLLSCVPCGAGFECTNPPCYGACTKCKKGFYKATTLSSGQIQMPGSTYDTVSSSYVRSWIKEPCYPCPANTYRDLEGGTELGACTSCPAKSTTRNTVGNTDISNCTCDSFYYLQTVSNTAGTAPVCADCPQGCVCGTDRSCSLGTLGPSSRKAGDIQSNLKCSNPDDLIVGTWRRRSSGDYELIECPPGYTLQASNLSVTSDTCVKCPQGKYLLTRVDSTSISCNPCPVGAECPGGNIVNALPGYWEAATSRRLESSTNGLAVLYQCPIGVCGSNNTCQNGRTGLVRHSYFFNEN